MALGAALLLAGCGMMGGKSKSEAETPPDIVKPAGRALVTRCPVPKAYDDATSRQIQEAIEALPKDNVLRQVMKDYESERDDLRMCQ
jgi:hypothetical protein